MAKGSITLQIKQMQAIAKVTGDAQLGRLFRLILAHETGQEEAPPEDLVITWAIVRQQLEESAAKYQSISEKRKAIGRLGGLARSRTQAKQDEAKASKRKQNQAIANLLQKEDTPLIDNNINISKQDNIKKEKERKAFTPPTLEEVAAYCAERGKGVNPQTFVDFYASKGWMVGKNKMKDWKACVRTWENNSRNTAPATSNNVNDFRNEY